MDEVYIKHTQHGKYFWIVRKPNRFSPKNICVDEANKNECEFIVERQKNEKHRIFGYYKSVEDYLDENQYKNINSYEIICRECKLYFDIDGKDILWKKYDGKEETFFNEIIEKISIHYKAFFKHELKKEWLFISTASGIGETNSWKGKQKHSYHIVVNNGLFFEKNQDIKHFIKYIYEKETNEDIKTAIDKNVYGTNQSFKFPHQSKYGSTRIQKSLNGKFKDHLINKYSCDIFTGFYDFKIDEKQKNSKTTILLSDVGVIKNDVLFNNDVDITNLKQMLDLFENNDYEWDTFYKIACIIKNEGGSEKMFHSWSKLSSKYNEDETNNLWKSLQPIKSGFNIQTLTNLVTKKYPKLLKQKKDQCLDNICIPTIDLEKYGYETYEYEKRYCDSINKLVKNYDTLVLKSHLGTGKTTVICDLIKMKKFESVLCITPRVMFANSIFASLKKADDRFEFYKEINKNERKKCDFIVCQLESLTTIADKYDCIIFDECESNFLQFNSSTIKNFDQTTEKFKTIMQNAKSVLCSDAFITNRTLCLMNTLRPDSNKLYIHNTFQPYERKCYNVGHSDAKMCEFFEKFIHKKHNERNIVATSSKKNSDSLNQICKDADKSVLLINSLSSDKVAKQLQDVNSLWEQYQNVIYTTSITVGISYDSELLFDNICLHFSVFGSVVRDIFQASLRARYIKNNVLYYTNYSNYFSNERPRVFEFNKLKEIIKHRQKDLTEDSADKLDD